MLNSKAHSYEFSMATFMRMVQYGISLHRKFILIKEIAIDIMASIIVSFLIPNVINILIISLLELKYSKPELFEVASFQKIVVIADNSPF